MKRRQQGVALVTALLVVSLATVAAVAMATRLQVDMRRTGNLLHGEQAYAYAVAAESWAYVILRRDRKETKHDSLDEDWSTALPPIPVEGGFVSGRIEDLQGRFNVNNLVSADGEARFGTLEYYKRLLDLLGLEAALATALLDWIDADINATFPDGAEDDEYLRADLPYRAANRPLVDISELRLVKGYTPEVLALLEPHVTALPAATLINVNTATPVVLQALHADLEEGDVEQLLEARDEERDGSLLRTRRRFLPLMHWPGLSWISMWMSKATGSTCRPMSALAAARRDWTARCCAARTHCRWYPEPAPVNASCLGKNRRIFHHRETEDTEGVVINFARNLCALRVSVVQCYQ